MAEIFAGRQVLLKELADSLKKIESGKKVRLALIGERGIGKTALLSEFQRRAKRRGEGSCPLLYVDFERIVSSPEEFSVQYPAQLLAGYLRFNDRMALEIDYFDLSRLEEMGKALGSERINRSILELKTRLNKDKKNQRALVEIALSFPEELSNCVKRRLLVVIDEFPFLSDLDNFSGIKGIFDLFGKASEAQGNVSYVISGSYTTLMEDFVSSNPLYKRYRPIRIGAMDPAEGLLLISEILSQQAGIPPGLHRIIYNYSLGHPFYIVHIARSVARKALTAKELNPGLIQESVAEEILLPTGSIYLFCKYIYELALERAKSKSLLKAILHSLVQKDLLTLTQIGTLVERRPPEVSSLLHRLLEVDLVTKRDGRYSLRDRLLRLWLRFSELKTTTEKEYLWAKERLIQDLKCEIGKTGVEEVFEEARIVEIIKTLFRGQRFPGRLFKREVDVVLVAASRMTDLSSEEGIGFLIEGITSSQAIAGLAIGQDWLVIIRTKKAVDEPEIKRILFLKEKTERDRRVVIDRVWIISGKGFTKKGIVFAQKNMALLSDRDDWQELNGLLV